MMLLLLIPLVWLAIVALVVALCLIAARADAELSPLLEASASSHFDALLPPAAPGRQGLAASRPTSKRSRLRGTRLAHNRRRLGARGVR